MAVYVTSVSGGMCLTKANNRIVNKKPVGDSMQFWTIERKEGSENEIAIRFNADGNYLRAKAGHAKAPLELGAKQWWKTEEGLAQGSYWLKCLDFKDACLANQSGSAADNNTIYMWPYQTGWTHAMTFTFQDPKAQGFLSQPEQGGQDSAAEAAKMMEELKKREAAVVEKEAQVEKAATLSEEAEKRGKELDEKEKQLAAREEEYQARSRALEEREKARVSTGSAGRDDADAEEKQKELETLRKQQRDLSDKLAKLEAREKEVAGKEKRLAGRGDGSTGNASADDNEMAKENKRLTAELAAAKKEIANAKKNGISNGHTSLGPRNNGWRIPPPTNVRPNEKRPERKQPERIQLGKTIPGVYNKALWERFEAGRNAMKR